MFVNTVKQIALRSSGSPAGLTKCHQVFVLPRCLAAYQVPSYRLLSSASSERQLILPDNTIQSPVPDIAIPRDVSMHEHFFKICDTYKNKTAMTDIPTGKSFSYTQLKDRVGRCASHLHLAGLRKGDTVLVFSGNQLDFTVLFLACSYLGIWFSPANPQFTPNELNRQINHSGSIAVFTAEPLAATCDLALQGELPHTIQHKYVFGRAPGYAPFSSLVTLLATHPAPDVHINPVEDILTLPYSSGTTGLPKGVMLSHTNCLANVLQINESMPMTEEDRALALLPLYHIYGMVVVQFGVLNGGGHLFYMPKFEINSFLESVQKHEINLAHLVPPLVVMLAKHPAVENYDLRSLRRIYSGAAPLGTDVTEATLTRLPGLDSINQVYGMTETSPVLTCDRQEIQGSIGPLVANTTAKVADINSNAALPPGEVGELCVKGPQVMKGYFKNQKATDEIIDEEGWLHTGDIVYAEAATGAVFMKDRIKELIKYKGSQVAPAELEDLLIGHSGIQDAAVVGVPDEMAGELPKAFVVRKPGSDVNEAAIKKFIEERVAASKKLRGGVQFVDEIPKNPSGKILRRVIKAKYL